MSFSGLFIARPVMTCLLMIALVIFGAFGYSQLPVSELPNVDFPTIAVTTSLPGADPETMASAVATPLESQFSTIAGVDSMTSTSSQGTTRITLQFSLDRNIDGAAQDVQSAISTALRDLPADLPNPPSMRKVNPSDSPILFLALSSPTLPLQQVDEYGETMLAQRLSSLPGVAQVNVYGSQKFAVRIQLNPDALAARGIGLDEVQAAAQAGNVNLPTGSLEGSKTAQNIRADGQIFDAATFRQQIVAYRNGAPVRLGDIGTILDSVENDKVASWFNNERAIVLAIQRQPGSNTIEVVNSIRRVLPSFEAQLPPAVNLNIIYDRSQSIRAAVSDVQFTLMLAAALVVLVIFIFLRNISATLIPSLALPISIIGTFAGMSLMGYSLDNLSLMALTLSVGFVVDDAIVMLENIVRHMEAGDPPLQAAIEGAREIGFTIMSMTLSLAAVFIPVLFMGGIIGRLLHEFAVTIVLAILVSGIVSLTLTPMLCSRFVRAQHGRKHGLVYRVFERGFDVIQGGYAASLGWALRHRPFIFLIFIGSLVGTVYFFRDIPKDFLPSEDTNQIVAYTEGADGLSFAEMVRHQDAVTAVLREDPNIAAMMSAVGAGGPRATSNSGNIVMRLIPRDQRKLSADQIIQELRPKLAQIPGINVYMQNPPVIRVGGNFTKSQYQYTLQSLDLHQLYDTAEKLLDRLQKTPGFQDVTSDMDLTGPTVDITIDRARAAALGISAQQIEQALAASFGSQQISTIYTASNQYQVIVELEDRYQRDAAALGRLYIRSAGGTLTPLREVVKISHGTSPLTVNHQGQLPSATISFNLPPGRTLSQAEADHASSGGLDRHAGQRGDELPGHGPGLPGFDPGPGPPARPRGARRLYRAGDSLRELLPPPDHPLGPALGGHGGADRPRAGGSAPQPLCLRRHHHAGGHRQEERDHDDRLRLGAAARGRHGAGGRDPGSLRHPLPPHHDDDHGRLHGRAAHRGGAGDRLGIAPAAGHRHRRRPRPLPAPDPLHHPGALSLYGECRRLVRRRAQDQDGGRGPSRRRRPAQRRESG